MYKEYKIIRYDTNGGQLEFAINGWQENRIYHFNTQNPPYRKVSVVYFNNNSFFQIETPTKKVFRKSSHSETEF
jgi:hypothetical protein